MASVIAVVQRFQRLRRHYCSLGVTLCSHSNQLPDKRQGTYLAKHGASSVMEHVVLMGAVEENLPNETLVADEEHVVAHRLIRGYPNALVSEKLDLRVLPGGCGESRIASQERRGERLREGDVCGVVCCYIVTEVPDPG